MSQAPPSTPRNTARPPSSGEANGAPEPMASSSKDALGFEPTLDTPSRSVPSLDFSPELEEEPQRTGAKSSKGSLSSSEKKRRNMSRVSMVLLALGLSAHAISMGKEWDEDELKAMKMKLEDAPSTRWGRTIHRYTEIFDYFNKPAWPELLPPPLPAPHQKPYTLLISLDDLLVTSTWDRQYGWRTAKRPGVDYFLAYISQFYEVVIFTSQPSYTAGPILDKLDRYGFFITYRLFREATRSVNGQVVKDLSYLNRDLSKVILLDTKPEHIVNPENAVVLPKWKGESGDKGLVAMIPFLESIAIYKPPDVRPIVKAYEGKDVPTAYGKLEAEMKTKHIEEWKGKTKTVAPVKSFGSVLGFSSTPIQSQSAGGPPPTYLEQKRAEAQRQYLEEQKYINDNKAQLEKLLEQDQQAMAAQVPGNLWEAIDQFRGGPPPPPPPGAPTPAGASGAPVGSVVAAVSSGSSPDSTKKA
ncbi:HAD-like domain-containing protein [Crepidotus variabilis]|uniref:Mitochondrial import inner membrane translocase subunit TIM50 n=1 Tax=Crepidotus variabilis TaxID=179855 RepID=A0A9P6JL60_9AGAR|nr:HAD-like domain-containing protein [Crepidotus variabilis]